ncbi:MAG: hypothetical protein ACI3ZB_06070 [Prevotella sp.]
MCNQLCLILMYQPEFPKKKERISVFFPKKKET